MAEHIITYTPDLRNHLERFREETFAEGNSSLSHSKFDPDSFNGMIWMAFEDDRLVSISAAEVSHYTAEDNVVRKCRYHILRDYRHGRYGFKFLGQMIPWCRQQGYDLLYWTHDVTNKPLNALYQRKRTYAFTDDNAWFMQWPYTELHFETDMLFRTGPMLQFVYSIKVNPSFIWRPRGGDNIYYYPHEGRVVLWDDIKDVAIPAAEMIHG